MATLVGDLIIGVRSIIPDMPGTLQTPATPSLAAIGGSIPAGTYTVLLTAINTWGETDTASASITLAGAGGIRVTFSAVPGATGYRVYIGSQYWQGTGSSIDISNLTNGTINASPRINRAWCPDSDGDIFPAITIYSWLREALNRASDITGGIYDATGVRTSTQVAMYQVGSQWKKFTHAWWDGWQLGLGNKGDAFYRNRIDATTGIVFTDVRGKNAIIEYYPIPNRTGGSGALVAGISATESTLQLNTSTFFLQYGLAQVDNEIVAYQSMTGGSLVGCLRGLGGTVAAAHSLGATVYELNGRFAGYRYATIPTLGSASQELDIPASWDAAMPLYLESRYREAERRFRESKELRDSFEAELKRTASSVRAGLLMGPRQIGEQYVNEVYGSGAKMGGGWMLP